MMCCDVDYSSELIDLLVANLSTILGRKMSIAICVPH